MKRVILSFFRSLGYDVVKTKNNKSKVSGTGTMRIGNYMLLIPDNYSLADIMRSYPFYSINLSHLSIFLNSKTPSFKIIDVGANIGDSVALIRSKINCPILCFEGTDQFYELLQKNTKEIPEVYTEHVFLGENIGDYIHGESVIVNNTATINSGSNKRQLKISSIDAYLAINSLFADARLLKIDTDGFDLKIINGAWNFINKVKPVIFFEYDYDLFSKNQDNGFALFQKFNVNGYEKAIVYDNYGRLLIQIETSDTKTIQFLTNYIKHKEHSVISYYDIIIYHNTDNALMDEFIKNEIAFQDNI